MLLNAEISAIRKDYKLQTLDEKDIENGPIEQFAKWFNEAIASKVQEVNAMTLATCSIDGYPTARIVLLKGFNKEGFIFYTNYDSKKGKQLVQNPRVCLVFFWKELERQVRIEGVAKRISAADSDRYFLSRPVESQLSALSSPQSTVIKDRDYLEKNVEYYRTLFSATNVKRPPNWGGYITDPAVIEFWQGRQNRLHDRLQYTRSKAGWQIDRLAP